ncbi:MAG: DHA2 family efflux MFS transporter permease subunit [Actinomycetota bacterium]
MTTESAPPASRFAIEHRRAYERRWWVMAILSASVFLVVVDNLIVNVALPTLQRELDASVTSLQWIVDAYALVFACLLLAGGGIGDRWGRKRALQVGLVLFAVFSGFGAFANSADSLVIWRGAMGVGAALVFPATLAIITNLFVDPIERAKAIGLWSAVSGMAVAFGPVAGGFLLEHFWWGSVFLVNIPIVALALIIGHFLIPESREPHRGRFDVVGLGLSVVAIGVLVYTVIESPHWGWGSAKSIAGFAIATATLALFIRYEARRDGPLLDVTFFRNARFSAATGSIGIAFLCLFGFTFLVTQYFQFVRGYDPLESGLRTLPFAVGAGVTAPLAARAALRWGTTRVVTAGLFNMSMGFLIVSQIDADTAYWGPIVISMLLIANGLSLVTSPSTEAVMGSVPRERAGVASAVNDISRELGGTLGVAITGSIFISLYTPKIIEAFTNIPGLVDSLPDGVFDQAQDSVGAAYAVVQNRPDQVQPLIVSAVSESFMNGFGTACLVVSAIALLGSVLAWRFLPARSEANSEVD